MPVARERPVSELSPYWLPEPQRQSTLSTHPAADPDAASICTAAGSNIHELGVHEDHGTLSSKRAPGYPLYWSEGEPGSHAICVDYDQLVVSDVGALEDSGLYYSI